MTEVYFSALSYGWVFECSGHAGSNREYASDIVCAAVSALCLTLARSLEQAQSEGTVRLTQYAVSDGYVFIEAEYGDGDYSRRITDTIIHTVMTGFDAISEEYGEYVTICG